MVRRWADIQLAVEADDHHGRSAHYDTPAVRPRPRVRLVGIGALAIELERSAVSIRRWERQGVLPPPPYRLVSDDLRGERRLFTPEVVQDVAEVFRRHKVGRRLDLRLKATIRREVDAVYAFHGHNEAFPERLSRQATTAAARGLPLHSDNQGTRATG